MISLATASGALVACQHQAQAGALPAPGTLDSASMTYCQDLAFRGSQRWIS